MLVFDENSQPVIIDNIYAPTVTEFVWVLDLAIMDYTLAPLQILEEIICPSITVEIMGFQFPLPANWYLLVYDKETTQLDNVPVADLAGREFSAVTYGPTKTAIEPAKVVVTNYNQQFVNVAPSLNKHQMLCHPVSPNTWVNVSSADVYNKYLKDAVIGDII